MIPQYELSKIVDFAEKHDVNEIWQFGSSIDPEVESPNDIDIGFIYKEDKNISNIDLSIFKGFPQIKFDYASTYNVRNPEDIAEHKYHFVFYRSDDFKKPIYKSLKNGKCLWKNK